MLYIRYINQKLFKLLPSYFLHLIQEGQEHRNEDQKVGKEEFVGKSSTVLRDASTGPPVPSSILGKRLQSCVPVFSCPHHSLPPSTPAPGDPHCVVP